MPRRARSLSLSLALTNLSYLSVSLALPNVVGLFFSFLSLFIFVPASVRSGSMEELGGRDPEGRRDEVREAELEPSGLSFEPQEWEAVQG